MNFQNINSLNVRVNLISGNLLPLSKNSHFSITWKIYSFFVWLVEVIQAIVLIPGMILVPLEKILKDGTVTCVVTLEVFFMIIRIQAHKKLMIQLIEKLNNILRAADETMKNIVTTTLKPMEDPLKFYFFAGWLAVLVWCCIPFLLVFEKVSFLYEDYRIPAVFSKQPFSIDVFLVGNVILLLSNVYIFVKKVGVDIYTIHLVLLITAQYRYIATKLATIFRDENSRNEFDGFSQKYQFKDQSIKLEMEALCRHHNSVIHLSSMLKKLLSVNFSMLYVNSVLRFCFIGVMLSTSQNVTDIAFHEKWYQFGPSVKRTFMLMILGNNLGCKLSMCDKFNLSLPSFMTILNQSYSIALLLLRVPSTREK
ncbi:Odorant receptor 416 [Nylanderia fulva]|uniref:Odorant receptor n=1 Tax=Nylanderia fulva TaxID=613905 RepID=A0A6G1LPT6_9HYME|nr:Odorant receptor 416 [Nylanderia fulva]